MRLFSTRPQVQARGEFEEAESYFTRALDIGRKMYGPAHPNVATGLSNLAGLLRCQGERMSALLPVEAEGAILALQKTRVIAAAAVLYGRGDVKCADCLADCVHVPRG